MCRFNWSRITVLWCSFKSGLRRLLAYSSEVFFWFREAAAFGLLVLIVGAACVTIWLHPTEDTVKCWGLALQVVGVLAAICGVLSLRKFFTQETLLDALVN